MVVAERGSSGLERVLLGTVAEQVVRYAPCAVLVARSSARSGHILAATDFSDPSLPALAAAVTEAGARGAVAAFHAVAIPMLGPDMGLVVGSVLPGIAEIEQERNLRGDAQLQEALTRLGATAIGASDSASPLRPCFVWPTSCPPS